MKHGTSPSIITLNILSGSVRVQLLLLSLQTFSGLQGQTQKCESEACLLSQLPSEEKLDIQTFKATEK
jgi:hypothetical protein